MAGLFEGRRRGGHLHRAWQFHAGWLDWLIGLWIWRPGCWLFGHTPGGTAGELWCEVCEVDLPPSAAQPARAPGERRSEAGR